MHSDIARQPPPRDWDRPGGELVTITVDGKTFEAPKGMLLIEAAERNGVYIPRFCWHNRMQPVAMCRMCLVQIDGVRNYPPSCTTPVADMRPPDQRSEPGVGMVVHTQNEAVTKIQDGILEFLLINHPLDCPVCDRGGECPLQDQTMFFGPGESRFVEEKRHYEKPIPVSGLVALDRERCVLCARCTRFGEEISGEALLEFVERGTTTQVLTFPDDPITPYFSGNVVQLCPVGALTARPYRFRARPWDLQDTESVCTQCSVGCRIEIHSSANQVVRHLGVDSQAVNQSWLCDKGRFGYQFLTDPGRVSEPLVDGREVTWGAALDVVAAKLKGARVGVLGGARGTNESAFALARLARDVLGTNDIDCQMGDGLPAEFVLGLPAERRATIDDLELAKTIVVTGVDLREEVPVLFLRVRRAATALRARLIDVGPRDTAITGFAREVVRVVPGEEAAALAGLDLGDGPSVVIIGAAAAGATAAAYALEGTKVLPVLRRGNVNGALEAGCAPGVLPGRVPAPSAGRDCRGILEALRDGDLDAVILVGADPVGDFPAEGLAAAALEKASFVVALDTFLHESCKYADVVFPAAAYAEQDGTVTNLEGRVSALRARVTPPGTARPDWETLGEIAARLGADLGLDSPAAIGRQMAETMPSWAGLRPSRIGRGPLVDGVIPVAGPLTYHAAATPAPEPTPPKDGYGVRVVAGRTLYDHGVMVQRSPALAHLAPDPFVALHPRELERLGLTEGAPVVIKSATGTVTLPTVVDRGTPEGVAYIPFAAARPLIAPGDTVIEARLETPR